MGRSDLYRLNDNHILAERVRALFTSEDRLRAQLIDYLRAELPHRIGAAKAAYLFGSASRGTTTPSSDIDVAIVGPKRSEADLEPELAALADKVRERFGSELNVIVDVRGRNGRRTGLWRQIERDGVSLLAGSKRG